MKTRISLAFALFFSLLMAPSVSARVTVIGGLTHERQVKPGETNEGVVFVRNSGSELTEVKVYQTDYTFSAEGTKHYGEPGKLARSNADWISFRPRRTDVAPGETATIQYTARIPNDPALAGTYWSMLMVEEVPKGSPESSQAAKDQVQVGIRQVMRYGIQMVTQIEDTGEFRADFSAIKLLKEKQKRLLQVDVKNTGTRWLRPLLWAELYTENGSYMGRFEGERRRIYPDTSVRYRLDLSQVPDGTYKALVVADAGGDAVFGAKYTLKLTK